MLPYLKISTGRKYKYAMPEGGTMNLKNLSDQELMAETKAYVKQESALLLTILHHIKEIDRRRLYADYKQPGLLGLIMKEFGYPRDQAIRRIQAMRMLRELPQIEPMLETGELNLTHVGIAQILFSHEKKEGKPIAPQKKMAILTQVAGKTTREAQKIIFSHSTSPVKFKEVIKMVGADTFEVTFRTNEATVKTLEELRGMLAHSHPGISLEELIQKLAELGREEFQRVKPVAAPRPISKAAISKAAISKAAIRRQIWQRDENKCTGCGSTFALEEDHKLPKAKGGPYSLENMRLLCRSCNQRAAVKHFGVEKMNRHFHSLGSG
jgi:hypothetical protein